MEEPGGLQSMGCKESDMTEQLCFASLCLLIGTSLNTIVVEVSLNI